MNKSRQTLTFNYLLSVGDPIFTGWLRRFLETLERNEKKIFFLTDVTVHILIERESHTKKDKWSKNKYK